MKHFNKSLLCLLLVALLAAAALTGCANKNPETASTEAQSPVQTSGAAETTEAPSETAAPAAARQDLGQGDKLFYFDVSFSNGETASYAIHTDAETVGDALTGLELIQGDLADYGMYVTTVCGETLDWDADGMYWAFYENGEYAATGVDTTPVTEGATYAFAATKG